MNLKPLYHKEDRDYRVIYLPHSRWVAQHRGLAKGTREFDPWQDLHPAKPSRDEAELIMYQRKPLLKPTSNHKR